MDFSKITPNQIVVILVGKTQQTFSYSKCFIYVLLFMFCRNINKVKQGLWYLAEH